MKKGIRCVLVPPVPLPPPHVLLLYRAIQYILPQSRAERAELSNREWYYYPNFPTPPLPPPHVPLQYKGIQYIFPQSRAEQSCLTWIGMIIRNSHHHSMLVYNI